VPAIQHRLPTFRADDLRVEVSDSGFILCRRWSAAEPSGIRFLQIAARGSDRLYCEGDVACADTIFGCCRRGIYIAQSYAKSGHTPILARILCPDRCGDELLFIALVARYCSRACI